MKEIKKITFIGSGAWASALGNVVADNGYDVCEYCSTIEGFMIGFTESDPIMDYDEIPKFISTNDLLNRYLNEVHDVTGVGIYNINGDCIDKVYRQEVKKISKIK